MENKRSVAKPDGKLAVLIPGLGAVSTTLMAGVELARKGKGHPIGSLTQMGTARLGKRTDGRTVKLNELVPLAELKDVAFGAWDIIREDAYEVAVRSGVLSDKHLEEVKPFLQSIKPKQGVHDPEFVRRIEANHIKATKTHRESIEALRQDIRDFKKELNATRAVMVVCSSVETFRPLPESFKTLAAFEKALDENSPDINPTALYTYAAIKEGVPFANATPNASVDTPALQEMAKQESVAVAGRDLKSGQTMMKTVIAPALKARMLGLDGWFSTNILGNRDGEVLDDPAAFKAKEVTKSSVLDTILQPDLYPSCTRSTRTRWPSTTTRPAATRRRVGTTSTSPDGSAIRCRSRSTSSAATPSWPPRWCWTSRCSWTWPSGWSGAASRSGCPSTSRPPWRSRVCRWSTTSSSSSPS